MQALSSNTKITNATIVSTEQSLQPINQAADVVNPSGFRIPVEMNAGVKKLYKRLDSETSTSQLSEIKTVITNLSETLYTEKNNISDADFKEIQANLNKLSLTVEKIATLFCD